MCLISHSAFGGFWRGGNEREPGYENNLFYE